MDEEVLVFPASVLDRAGGLQGFSRDVERYIPAVLDPGVLSYTPRKLAEEDPGRKQLVAYAVLACGNAVYCYERGSTGGEARLHRRLSLGVGGHVSREDGQAGAAAYESGFARELAEEVEIAGPFENRIVGVVYDGSTAVGRVHFGVVHLLELESPDVRALDPALAGASFRPIEEVAARRDEFESWSAFVIDEVLLDPARLSAAGR